MSDTKASATGAEPNSEAANAAAAAAAPAAPVAAIETVEPSSPPANAAQTAGEGKETVDSTSPPPAGQQAKPEAGAAAKPEDWRDRRIRQLTAKLREEQEAREAAKPEQQPQLSQADIERRAAEIAKQNEFARQCDLAVNLGREAFGEQAFNERVGQLRQLVNVNDPVEMKQYADLIAAAIETGEAPKLLYALGSDLNRASELMGMTETRRAVELTKMAVAKGEPEPSAAPKPITPIGARAESVTPIRASDPLRGDKLSTSEWMKRRQAEIDERRKAGERVY